MLSSAQYLFNEETVYGDERRRINTVITREEEHQGRKLLPESKLLLKPCLLHLRTRSSDGYIEHSNKPEDGAAGSSENFHYRCWSGPDIC